MSASLTPVDGGVISPPPPPPAPKADDEPVDPLTAIRDTCGETKACAVTMTQYKVGSISAVAGATGGGGGWRAGGGGGATSRMRCYGR